MNAAFTMSDQDAASSGAGARGPPGAMIFLRAHGGFCTPTSLYGARSTEIMSVQTVGGWVTAMVVVGAVSVARAQPAPQEGSGPRRPASFIMRAGYEYGGDDLVTVVTADGDSKTVTGGRGGFAEGGLLIEPDAPIAIETTLGFKEGRASSVSFSRWTFDTLVELVHDHARIGAGVTMQFGASIDCGFQQVCNHNTIPIDTAYGALLQAAYTAGRFDFGLRATLISYRASRTGSDASASGNSLGAFVGVRL
jgi:hypothetical protein